MGARIGDVNNKDPGLIERATLGAEFSGFQARGVAVGSLGVLQDAARNCLCR
jgi:hypothetical protein